MRAMRRVVGIGVGLVAACAALAPACAAGRLASDYFRLDVPHAVLSPEPLGPPAHFERFGVRANSGPDWLPAPSSAAAPGAETADTAAASAAPSPGRQAASAQTSSRKTANRQTTHVAQRRASPYEARAAMAKPKPRPQINRWPCKSGGICAWQSPPAR
jgi:hypothetical protein